jgi:steroid delta-isomerase-like uncharacterized protein
MKTRAKCAITLLVGAVTIGACVKQPESRNKETARRVFAEILSEGHFERAAELYSPQFKNHGLRQDVSLREDQAAARGWKQAFPDLTIVPEKLIAERDLVSVYWIARGTNTGEGNGLPATGRHIEMTGVTIWRIENGRLTDEWSVFDQQQLLQQLGSQPQKQP